LTKSSGAEILSTIILFSSLEHSCRNVISLAKTQLYGFLWQKFA
jgi:hypothetical protein